MALSRFEFKFPEEALRVRSHLQWIKELIPHLERAVVLNEDIKDLKDYLRLLVIDNIVVFGTGSCGKGDAAPEENLSGESYRTSMGFIGCNLNMAAFYTYMGNYKSARSHLEQVLKKLAEESKTGKEGLQAQGGRSDAVKYCVYAIELIIKRVEYIDGIMEDERAYEIAVETERLRKSFKEIEGIREGKATLVFLEGFLAGGLQVKKEEDLKKFKEAAELDPDYHIWNHFAYRKIRYLRRTYRNKGDRLDDPSKEEHEYCKKAFELRPDYLPMIIDYALLLKELLWTKRGDWDENDVRKCDEMFKEALRVAKGDDTKYGKFWLRKLRIYYGEFLLFGRHSTLNQKFGRQLFDESLKEYPNDAFVLHKVAKLHHRGPYRGSDQAKKEGIDLEKAEKYFRGALISGWNYPCFCDYIKLVKEFRPYADLIKAIDDFPCTSRHDFDEARILVERGCIVWLFNPSPTSASKEEACQLWIRALVKFPQHADYVYDALERSHRLGSEKPARVLKHLVLPILEQIMKSSNTDEVEAVSSLLAELKKKQKRYEDKGKKPFTGAGKNNYKGQTDSNWRKDSGKDNRPGSSSDKPVDAVALLVEDPKQLKKKDAAEKERVQNDEIIKAMSGLNFWTPTGWTTGIGRGRGRGIVRLQDRDPQNEAGNRGESGMLVGRGRGSRGRQQLESLLGPMGYGLLKTASPAPSTVSASSSTDSSDF